MKFLPFSQTKLGSSLLLRANGSGLSSASINGQRISQSETRDSSVAEKSESESEGGQKFFPPTPFLFACCCFSL